jgi:predicted nucleic acid-binding protein
LTEYSPPVRANCFDASALVKVFTQEAGGEMVRKYFNHYSPTKYTTPFCFYEALSVLKVKWLYRKELSKEDYNESSFRLTAWYGATFRLSSARDVDLVEPLIFFKAREVAERYSVDLSDAFQILSVKEGFFSCLINDNQTLLVTADEHLAKIAKLEGIKSWYCLEESFPP